MREPTRYSVGAELVIYSDDICGNYIDYDDFVEYVAELKEAHAKALVEMREQCWQEFAVPRLGRA